MTWIEKGVMQELSVLRVISPDQGDVSKHCIRLRGFFQQRGKGEDGIHLCLIFDLLGGDVNSLICKRKDKDQRKDPVPLALAKRILLHTLRGIAHLHGLGIVHTDLKPNNIMFDYGPLSTEDLTALVTADPPRRNPPERVGDLVFQSAVSQPLPLPSYPEAMTRTYLIADLGSGKQMHSICGILSA
jgi:serine/threonine protein kinase